MEREKILEEVIEGYRATIYKRYQYKHIREVYRIPDSIDETTVNGLRDYFLTYMYPEFKKRAELNAAFESLDDFIKNPKQLATILLDAAKLIFTYGRHLPKLLRTGLDAMKSFKAAIHFENSLVDEAINNDIEPPYNVSRINTLITLLSRDDIEKFIEITQSLFETLHDRTLIKKIKEILRYLIVSMGKKKGNYSAGQIRGLEIGLEMLEEGDTLFNRLTKEDQRNLIYLIAKIERDHLDQIF